MNPDKEEIQRLLDVLRTLMRLLGFSNREVERRLGLKHSAITRLFGGHVEAKLELVLGVVRVIGLGYDEFFALTYPERRAAGDETAAALRIHALLADLQPGGFRSAPPRTGRPEPGERTPATEPVNRDELLQDLRKVVREVLGEVGAAGGNAPKAGNGE
jgi:transcriptional regulator with XRE-family HTH domain